MDSIFNKLTEAARRVREYLRSISESLSSLRIDLHDIKNSVQSIDKNAKTYHDKQDTPQVVIAEVHERESAENEHRAENNGKKRRDIIRLVIEGLTLLSVTFYGYMAIRQWREMISARHATQDAITSAKQSADAAMKQAHDNFVADQRPYVWHQPSVSSYFEAGQAVSYSLPLIDFGKWPAIEERADGLVILGSDAKDAQKKADRWFGKRKGLPLSKTVSPAILPPNPNVAQYFATIHSDKPLSQGELEAIEGIDGAIVVVAVIEYFDFSRTTRFESDICLIRVVRRSPGGERKGQMEPCQSNNDMQ